MDIIKPYSFIPKAVIETQADDILKKVKAHRRRPLKNCDIAEATGGHLPKSAQFLTLRLGWRLG